MTTIPEWVRHPNVDGDRLMVAAWLWLQGEADAALGIAGSVLGRLAPEDVVVAIAEALGEYAECHDDPQHFGWTRYALERPGGGSTWLEWGELICEELLEGAQRRVTLALVRAEVAA